MLSLKFLVTQKTDFLLIIGWIVGSLAGVWLICGWFVAGLWVVCGWFVGGFEFYSSYFRFLSDESLRRTLLSKITRQDLPANYNSIRFCHIHFEEDHVDQSTWFFIQPLNLCLRLFNSMFSEIPFRKNSHHIETSQMMHTASAQILQREGGTSPSSFYQQLTDF